MPAPVDITSIQKLQPLYKPYYTADKKIPNHLIKMHDFEPDDFSANKQELSELLSAAHKTGEEYTRLFICTEGDAAVKQQAMQDYLDRFEFGSKIKIEVIQGNSLPIDSPKRKSVNNKISGEVCLTSGHYDEALRREAEFQDKLKVDKNKTIAEWQINEAEIRRNAKNIIRNYIKHHPDAEISITAPPVLFLQMINEAKQLENEPEKPEGYITPAELGALFSKISQINMTGGFNWRDFFESLTDPREVENMENLINDFVNMFSGKFILAISDLTAHMLLTHEVDPSGTSIQESTKSITDLKYSNFTESYDEAEREFMVYWTKNKIRPDDFRFLRTCLYAIFPEGGISFKDLPAWDKLQPVFQRQFSEFDFSSQTITHEQWIPIFEGNFNKNVSDFLCELCSTPENVDKIAEAAIKREEKNGKIYTEETRTTAKNKISEELTGEGGQIKRRFFRKWFETSSPFQILNVDQNICGIKQSGSLQVVEAYFDVKQCAKNGQTIIPITQDNLNLSLPKVMTLYPGKPVPEEIAAQGSKESKEWVQTDFLAYLQMKKDYSKLVKSIIELESKIAEYRSKENLPMAEQLQINLEELKSRKAAFSDFEQRNRNVTHESVLRSYEANQTLLLCSQRVGFTFI